MNERIVALYKEHGFIDADCIEFGEILVRECIEVLRQDGELAKIQAVPSATYTYAALNRGANVVRDHFGIEERNHHVNRNN